MNDRSWEQVWGTARAGVKPEHRRLKNNQAWLPVLGDRLNEDGNLIGPNWFGIRSSRKPGSLLTFGKAVAPKHLSCILMPSTKI